MGHQVKIFINPKRSQKWCWISLGHLRVFGFRWAKKVLLCLYESFTPGDLKIILSFFQLGCSLCPNIEKAKPNPFEVDRPLRLMACLVVVKVKSREMISSLWLNHLSK